MKRSYLIIAAVVVVLGVGWWVWQRNKGANVAIDLLAQFPAAEKRSNGQLETVFGIQDVAIKGETRRVIYMHPTSRLTYKHVAIPEDGWLTAYLAIKEDVWDKTDSDGVEFRFGVSDGREYEELVKQHVNPATVAGDRRWIPISVDLSAYAGQSVDLIFNTGAGANNAWDWAVIGEPAVIVRR
jgi:hypothetical protein